MPRIHVTRINLLIELKNDFNLTILFISHDLSVIKYLSDRVLVMYLGEELEEGLTEEIFENPAHPYTKALLNAVPKYGKAKIDLLKGDLPLEIPKGCNFFSRCKYSSDECENCQIIASNDTTDILELDAASNNGVDDVRRILDNTKFLPVNLKYKVYIIDEAHMLTNSS